MVRWKILLPVVLIILGLVYWAVSYVMLPEQPQAVKRTRLFIPKGSSVRQIADSLKNKGLIEGTELFLFWSKTLDKDRDFKAGLFHVPSGLSYPQLIQWLTQTKPENITVRLIEGWPTQKILRTLSKKLNLDYAVLDLLIKDEAFCHSFNVKIPSLNGYLLPDTYKFPYGMSEKEVLRFLVQRTLAIFNSDSAQQVLKTRGVSVHQIMTMASIVEGEAMLDKERPAIASVYWNRFKRGMRLQADPTIQFLVKDGPRRLLYKDLKIESPYNTYLHKGLPPGPINNPGKASILAALFPAQTTYLYFVAKGDGSHVFSKSAAEHAKAKAAFNRVRRDVARKKRLKKGQ